MKQAGVDYSKIKQAGGIEYMNGFIQPITSNGLIYGEPGVGKTYLSSSVQDIVRKMEVPSWNVPEGYKIVNTTLYINAEQGQQGLNPQYRDVVIKTVEDYNSYCRIFEFLKAHQKLIEQGNVEQLIKNQGIMFGPKMADIKILFLFRAVIIDSLTEIQKLCIYDIRNIDNSTKLNEDFQQMLINDWGNVLEKILLMIRKYRNLPMIKVFLAQQEDDQDDRGKKYYRPMMQGQSKLSALGFFDYVGYYVMSASETKVIRRLHLSPTGQFKAKARFANFSKAYIDNPCMADLLMETVKTQEEQVFEWSF